MTQKDLKITNCDDSEPYVFISYSSADANVVLDEYICTLQEKYGLRIYYDKSFREHANESWTKQMIINLQEAQCAIIFVSDTYKKSYACLLELLSAIAYDKPIIRVQLNNSSEQSADFRKEQSQKISEHTRNAFKDIEEFLFLDKDASSRITTAKRQLKLLKYQLQDGKIRVRSVQRAVEECIKSLENMILQGDIFESVYATLKNLENKRDIQNVFEEPEPQNTVRSENESNSSVRTSDTNATKLSQETVNDNENKTVDKIGEFVRKSMKALQDKGYRFTDEMLSNLFSFEYSKEKFRCKYSFFIDDKSKIRDNTGHNRYWVQPFIFNGRTLYITSQWFDYQREYFENWYNSLQVNPFTPVSKPSQENLNDNGNKTADKIGKFEGTDKSSSQNDTASSTPSDVPNQTGKRRIKSATKDTINFTVYGEKFSGNQNVFMQKVFEKVLRKHENIVDKIVNAQYMNCLSCDEDPKESYFRSKKYYEDIAGGIWVGTSYGSQDKAKCIATLLLYCGESLDILICDDEKMDKLIKIYYQNRSARISAIKPADPTKRD